MKNRRTKKRDDTSAKQKASRQPRKEPKKATKGIINSIEYDSLEELAVLQWLFELKAMGYIKSIKRSPSYLLCDSFTHNYVKNLKTTSRPETQCLLHGHSYTPEFVVTWDKKSLDKLIWDIGRQTKFDKVLIARKNENGEYETHIEVKPSFDQNNMERLFKLNQKWMWDKHKVSVNLLKVNELFPHTFTPKAYLTTPSGRRRLLKWKNKTLFNFLNNT